MNKPLRILLVLALVLGVALLAKDQVARAGFASEPNPSSQAQSDFSAAPGKPDPGTVKPPKKGMRACENGLYSVGGVATFSISDLVPGYCLEAFLHNKNYALGRIPDGAGQILANVTFFKIHYRGKFVYEIPLEDGDIEICFAVPPGKEATIYFYDHYGPRFGERTGQPSWEPLPTTVEDGIACAPAQTSGAYALIGQ